jgi:hypothetical protein
MSSVASVMPYIGYGFSQKLSQGDIDIDLENDSWNIGAQFKVQF